ncbi:hypothetical protein RSOLAG22IIIB_12552 [Rhizoctonia solani]|uniref:Transmembrane protein n=1 Tax=Rhizoctonia solani TaxID=456999 RepID=A0A0K6GEQ3_9AGAM|nr:hypothetical protein RSOLAG22IIIB_12552 [Rhizoctonia solani]
MSSFLRIAGAAALVLSLGLAARALPVSIFAVADADIKALVHGDAVCAALNKLIVDARIVAKLQACLNVSTIAELQIAIAACVASLKVCADALLKLGAGVVVDAAAKADIVACIAALITLIVKVCVQLSLKFGVSVVASLCAELDVCVRLLLANLDICITGIVALIVKAVLSVTVGLMAQVNLAACAKLFIGN